MTPTLLGRWQTRTLLLLTIGFVLTLPFVFFLGLTPLLNLALVLVLGHGWDIVYNALQKARWDRDWPPAYQLFAGVWEGIATFVVGYLLSRAFPIFATPVLVFVVHYGLVWTATFLASQSVMRVIFPLWRYRGGQWI